MASYDLFIKGIHPERLDEQDQIKKKASHAFKIAEDQLEVLWSSPSGLCIRRDISKEEASQIQSTLTKAGLVCLNRPAASNFNLSLEAKQADESLTKRQFSCPYCEIKIALDISQADPAVCPECSGIIAKYAETQERKEIRNRLMNSKAAKERHEMELDKAEAERMRKQKLEEEIGEEIFGKQKIKISKPLLIAGGAAILIVSGAMYYLTNSSQDNSIAANATSAGQDHSPAANALSGEAPPLSFPAGGATDAQSALQNTHDKANKVLGAFGLDADKLGKNVGQASGTSKLVSMPPSNVPGDMKKTAPLENSNDAVTPIAVTLLNDGENNQEWDMFLTQQITRLIETNKLANAYKAASYLIDTESYINTMGLILANAQHSNQDKLVNEITAAIESRINTLPISKQPEYLAQAGYFQLHITQKNDLLARAEVIWKQLANSDDQLKAALKIAVYNFKSGNIETANIYFNQIDSLLAKSKTPDEQVSARSAIGRAYYDVNDNTNNVKWLASTEKLITEVTGTTLKELIGSYAYSNQLQPATIQSIAKEKQDELLYHAIQVSLKNNLLNNATTLSQNIQDPTFKALASDLIASYDPDSAVSNLNFAEKQLQNINLPADKAIVASRLSRHYSRLGNTQKATELMALSEKQLVNLPSSNEKDNVLILVIKNFARGMQFDAADNLTLFIHADTIKSSMKNDINRLREISASLLQKAN